MEKVWTWGGKYFGYFNGDSLYTYKGKHIGNRRNDRIFSLSGGYLGELRNNRLISKSGGLPVRSTPTVGYADRAEIVKNADYVGSVMIAGYEDFPAPESF